MSEFQLTIATPSGIVYNDTAESIIIRTISGDVGILNGHAPYAAALSGGEVRIRTGSAQSNAICASGMLFAAGSEVKIAVKSFQWIDKVGVE